MDGWPKPGALAGKTGELIEFMEQAFEWRNLQYVAYPYYWADSKSWMPLLAYDHADPHVREFVRSGAVRMVVPVRLDLSEAVMLFPAGGRTGERYAVPHRPDRVLPTRGGDGPCSQAMWDNGTSLRVTAIRKLQKNFT